MENPENLELSRFYAFTMKSIGQKLLCKMYVGRAPHVKTHRLIKKKT